MREILPGVRHWTTFHEGIRTRVSSYFVEPAGAVIDPRVPDEGLDAVAEHATPQQIILTTGLHARHAEQFAESFDCPIRASRQAQERIGGALATEVYEDGDEIAPGVTAIHIGALAPDEFALHLGVDGGAIALADALMHYGGEVAFVPDFLMGDDPEGVKRGLVNAFQGLLTRDFEHILFAHGDPLVGGGKTALREVVKREG